MGKILCKKCGEPVDVTVGQAMHARMSARQRKARARKAGLARQAQARAKREAENG